MNKDKQPTVAKGDIIELEVMNIGSKGDAVCKHKGMVVFIKKAQLKIGDYVECKITNVTPTCAFAELVE